MTRIALLLLPLLLLAGCAGMRPESVTERDTRTACRQQAEQIYRLRHRDEIYGLSNSDAPASGAVGLTLPSQGLADRFEQEREISSCVHDVGTGASASP
ncbi:MAG: hypothetical protein KGL52_17290 [Rhodospirillales bacterium]|jgi:hypothetical protein|nr:hypothetical protein [Rhodospirillales bacterium]